MKTIFKNSVVTIAAFFLFLAIGISTVYGVSKWQKIQTATTFSVEDTNNHNHEAGVYEELFTINYVDGAITKNGQSLYGSEDDEMLNNSASTKKFENDSEFYNIVWYSYGKDWGGTPTVIQPENLSAKNLVGGTKIKLDSYNREILFDCPNDAADLKVVINSKRCNACYIDLSCDITASGVTKSLTSSYTLIENYDTNYTGKVTFHVSLNPKTCSSVKTWYLTGEEENVEWYSASIKNSLFTADGLYKMFGEQGDGWSEWEYELDEASHKAANYSLMGCYLHPNAVEELKNRGYNVNSGTINEYQEIVQICPQGTDNSILEIVVNPNDALSYESDSGYLTSLNGAKKILSITGHPESAECSKLFGDFNSQGKTGFRLMVSVCIPELSFYVENKGLLSDFADANQIKLPNGVPAKYKDCYWGDLNEDNNLCGVIGNTNNTGNTNDEDSNMIEAKVLINDADGTASYDLPYNRDMAFYNLSEAKVYAESNIVDQEIGSHENLNNPGFVLWNYGFVVDRYLATLTYSNGDVIYLAFRVSKADYALEYEMFLSEEEVLNALDNEDGGWNLLEIDFYSNEAFKDLLGRLHLKNPGCKLTLIPFWKPVTIRCYPEYPDDTVYDPPYREFLFGQSYDKEKDKLPNGFAGGGKTFYCYAALNFDGTQTLISQTGVWNYSTIPCDYSDSEPEKVKGKYKFIEHWEVIGEYGDVSGYELHISSVALDNLIKVCLSGVDTHNGYYELQDWLINNEGEGDSIYGLTRKESTEYVFNSYTGNLPYEITWVNYKDKDIAGDKGNEWNYDEYNAAKYPSMDAYSVMLAGFKAAYEKSIKFESSSKLDAMCKVYVDEKIYLKDNRTNNTNNTGYNENIYIYLPCNQKAMLPTFITDTKIVVAWRNDDSCDEYCTDNTHTTHKIYASLSYNKDLASFSVSADGIYKNHSTLYPIYRNILRMYSEKTVEDYENGTKTNYNETLALYYGSKDHRSDEKKLYLDLLINGKEDCILGYDLHLGSEYKYTFGGWVFDSGAATAQGYDLTYANGVLTVTKTDDNINYDIINFDAEPIAGPIAGTYNYIITSVSGKEFVQNPTNPIIRVKWNRAYNITFKNSSDLIYWKGFEDTNTTDMYGAISKNGKSNGADFETTIMVSSFKEWFEGFEFMSSDGVAFLKSSDFEANTNCMVSSEGGPKGKGSVSYAVYNYGYQVKAYLIYFEHNGTKYEIYKDINSGKFDARSYDGEPIAIELTDLNKQYTTLDYLASFMDDFLFSKDENNYANVEITIVPIWEQTTILIETEWESKNISFGDSYELADKGSIKESSRNLTHFAYSVENVDFGEIGNAETAIAINAVWNYTQLKQDNYSFIDDENVAPYYRVKLYPIYLDDLTKVKLNKTNIVTNSEGYFELDNGLVGSENQYKFSNEYDKDSYSFKTVVTLSSFQGGLADVYVETIIGEIQGYVEADLDIFKNVYTNDKDVDMQEDATQIQTDGDLYVYLVANKPFKLPTFKDELGVTLAWTEEGKLYSTTKYSSSDTYEEEFKYTGCDRSDVYIPKTKILEPYYIYSFNLYYDSYSNKGTYSSVNTSILEKGKKERGYLKNQYVTFYNDEANLSVNSIKILPAESLDSSNGIIDYEDYGICDVVDGKPYRIFECWMLDVTELLNNKDYTIKVDEGNYVEISDGFNKWSFNIGGTNEYEDGNEFGERKFYYITGIGSATARFEQDDFEKPVIVAKWSNIYNIEINNSKPGYWDVRDEGNDDLYFAKSSSDGEGSKDNAAITTLSVANHEIFDGLGFAKSEDLNGEGLAFGYAEAKSGNGNYWYRIKHVGHYIKGYELSITINDIPHYFVFKKGKWSKGTTYSDINELLGVGDNGADSIEQTLVQFAKQLDEYLLVNPSENLNVRMKPIWSAATISASLDGKNELLFDKVSFGDTTYTIDVNNNNLKKDGKSIMAFNVVKDDTVTNKLVATKAVWNYTKITQYSYTPAAENEVLGSGIYSVILTPVYVDNIYKVSLTNVQKTSENYELMPDTYVFNSTAGLNINGSGHTITDAYKLDYSNTIHDNSNFVYNYTSYDDFGTYIVDYYIENLENWINIYTNGISDGVMVDGENKGLFSCLRKVFYNNGEYENESILQPTNPNSQPEMWIYLANNQSYGNLPVFESNENTLIYWADNSQNPPSGYIYKTITFEEDDNDHQEEIKNSKYHNTTCDCEEKSSCKGVWNYKDCDYSTSIEFKASYFRKYFYLSIETLKEEEIERRGYVTIELTDCLYANNQNTIEDRSAKYVFICDSDSSKMQIYRYYDNIFPSLVDFIEMIESMDYDDLYDGVEFEPVERLNAVRVYSGCSISIHVYDQSQDVKSMISGSCDNMIGYKFAGEITQSNKYKGATIVDAELLFEEFEYEKTVDSDALIAKNYSHASFVLIDVNFEKIEYQLTLDIDLKDVPENKDFYSGHLKWNNRTIKENAVEITDVTVENMYELYYYAYAGFKLQEDSFVLNINSENIVYLQDYSENIAALSDEEKKKYFTSGVFDEQLYLNSQQTYIMEHSNPNKHLDGAWLRNFYYSLIDDNYDVDNTNLGVLKVQTEPIVFNFGLKIYNSNLKRIIEEVTDLEAFSSIQYNPQESYTLDEVKMVIYNDYNFLTGIEEDGYGFYHYKAKNGDRYAVLSSRLYFPDKRLSATDGNYNDPYNFTGGATKYSVSPRSVSASTVSAMLVNPENGKILVTTDRNLFLMFEVRELYKINIQVERQAGDPNATTRSTTVSNGNGNSKTLTLSAGSLYDGNTNVYNTTESIYTYLGLENSVSSYWEENSYSDAQYYLNDSTECLSTSQFTLGTNDVYNAEAKLTVKFIPESLKIVHEYYLNGQRMVKDFEGYVSETVTPKSNLKLGDVLNYNLKCLKNNFTVTVRINSSESMSTTLAKPELEMEYEITELDYQYNQITIRVEINALPEGSIQIKYYLAENNVLTDNYGTFTVYQVLEDAGDEPEVVDESVGGSYQILTGRTVYVQPELEPGFYYIGKISFNTFSAKDIELDSEGRLDVLKAVDSLTDGFDPDVSTGIFTIYIAKTPITVKLNREGVIAGSSYTLNNQNQLDNMYVNSTINFNGTQVDGQRFISYYYINQRDETVRFNNISTTKLINAELLNDMLGEDNEYSQSPEELVFYVETVNTYRAEFVIEGTNYLDEFKIQINGENLACLPRSVDGKQNAVRYVTGYYDHGSELTFTTKTVNTGKYQIEIENPQSKYSLGTGIDNSGKYDLIEFGNLTAKMHKNHTETIKITPYSYNATVVSEYVFKTISQINSNKPDLVTSGCVNGLTQENLTYGAIGVIKFARVVSDRELCTVYISGNDMSDKLCIKYNQTDFAVYKVEIDPKTGNETVGTQQVDAQDYGLTIRNLTASGNVEISFETLNNINIDLEYVLYKTIKF